jgi:filamentous hemagglutinin
MAALLGLWRRAFETKNYDINRNSDGLVSNVTQQVLERTRHLPPGMQQNINVDIRGQRVTNEQLDEVARRIVDKSNGLLARKNVKFKQE